MGTLYLHHAATDFPIGAPHDLVRVVDAALVERLRAEPGLHLPLAPDHRFAPELALDLVDDPLNRRVYGTVVDLRERRATRAIHLQVRPDGRGAIHADGHNPTSGVIPWLVHATVDVPFLPLPIVFLLGVWLLKKVPEADPESGSAG